MMEWLTPMTGLIAAAAAVPTLVLLYFLKLKRREVPISSTLLWRRAVQDLQVNAPFQRLRRNILLLLQLLALAAVLLALAGPVMSLRAGPGRRYVILIDRSASMNARDADGRTRLQEAQRQAGEMIESLRGGSLLSLDAAASGDQAMVIAFDRHARVMCNFMSDKAQLASAVEAVEPTDGPSELSEAVTVARAFAQSPGLEANNRSGEAPPQLELFSDGRIADLKQVVVGPGELAYHRVGSSSDNVGVTAMQARRSYENPDEVHVFAGLCNAGPKEVICDVQLSLDGTVRAVRAARVPAARPAEGDSPAQPGKVSVSFILTHAAAGRIEVRQLRPDALPSDDAAWAVLPPPKRLTVLLVTEGNPALHAALKASPLARLDLITPGEFDRPEQLAAAGQRYDVIILDNHAPAGLPQGRYIVFGKPPPDIGVQVGMLRKNQVIVDWRSRHPVLQFVDLGNVYAAQAWQMQLPREATLLAEFNDTPALALLRRRASLFLLAGFDVMETNWPFQAGFVMFCYNASAFLGLEAGQEQDSALRVGEAITLRADDRKEATVTCPDGRREVVAADPSDTFRFPATTRAGLYAVTPAARLSSPKSGALAAHYAVNLLDEAESDIEPAREIALSTETVAAVSRADRRANQELWPMLALAALALVCVEWLVYNSKVRL